MKPQIFGIILEKVLGNLQKKKIMGTIILLSEKSFKCKMTERKLIKMGILEKF